MSEIGLTEGFFVLQDAGQCASPKNNSCVVLQSETNNGRTAGHIYVYRENTWVDVADLVMEHQHPLTLDVVGQLAKAEPLPARTRKTKKEEE
jgi:hypothetical protein